MNPQINDSPQTSRADTKTEHTDQIYQFQHKVLPRWTHGTQGRFFSDLTAGSIEPIQAAAVDIVGSDFARELVVSPVDGLPLVLITFAEPTSRAECYYALIQKNGDKYQYFTLEMTDDFARNGTKTVFAEWDEAGNHHNHGFRKYTDIKSFIAEATSRAENRTRNAPATSKRDRREGVRRIP